MKNKELSVFIPCFNEEKNISFLVESWNVAIKGCPNIFVLFINNGSTDNTYNLLKKSVNSINNKNIDILNLQFNKGYGHGILEGINYTDSKHICWTHADLQFRAQDVVKIINKYLITQNQKKVFKGQRNSRSFFDLCFTKLMSALCILLTGFHISDINAQPKIFSRELFNNISKWPIDFSIDAHLLIESHKQKYEIVSNQIQLMPRKHEEAKGGGTLRGKLKLSIATLKYFLGFYANY